MKSTKETGIKTGAYIIFNKEKYLFLGYIDYKKKRCLLADQYGNKIEVWSNDLI